MRAMARGRTLINIARRFAAVRRADRIMTLGGTSKPALKCKTGSRNAALADP
jgi:hypothetical protein